MAQSRSLGGTWLCTPAQAAALPTQIGTSACGPTAVLNVLQLLNVPPTQSPAVNSSLPTLASNKGLKSTSDAAAVSTASAAPSATEDAPHSAFLEALPARQRNYSAPLLSYLRSRAIAGTTHLDLIQGVEKVSGGKVRFRTRLYFSPIVFTHHEAQIVPYSIDISLQHTGKADLTTMFVQHFLMVARIHHWLARRRLIVKTWLNVTHNATVNSV